MKSPIYRVPFEKTPLVQRHPWRKWWSKEDSINLYAQNLDTLFNEAITLYVTTLKSTNQFLFEKAFISELAKNKNIIINNKELQYIANVIDLLKIGLLQPNDLPLKPFEENKNEHNIPLV